MNGGGAGVIDTVIYWAISGAVSGAITGLVLSRLVSQPVRGEAAPQTSAAQGG
ncbi:MAG: hypothetical protein PVI59_02135 [Anaerolineae bacterium]